MVPVSSDELGEFAGGSGTYTSIRKMLKPGESTKVVILDMNKTTKTQYPIKGKDYAYMLSLEIEGVNYLMSINSKDLIRQVMACLYRQGVDKPLVPALTEFSRRVERKTHESEAQVRYLGPATKGAVAEDDDIPL